MAAAVRLTRRILAPASLVIALAAFPGALWVWLVHLAEHDWTLAAELGLALAAIAFVISNLTVFVYLTSADPIFSYRRSLAGSLVAVVCNAWLVREVLQSLVGESAAVLPGAALIAAMLAVDGHRRVPASG